MVGTGVFTSLGFQVGGLPSGFAIMVLWALGGVCALCGALCYAELAAALPRSGGEYHLLRRSVHPAAGFLAGWLSATVGFAAPIALAAMALGKYAEGLLPFGPDMFVPQPALHGYFLTIPFTSLTTPAIYPGQFAALLVTAAVTAVHLFGARIGSVFQNTATGLKLALILVVLAVGFAVSSSPSIYLIQGLVGKNWQPIHYDAPGVVGENWQPIHFAPMAGDAALLASAPFAVSLVFVMYAYSGWNAATYLAGEIRDPGRNIPRALLLGTALVAVLYLGLNAAFLRTTPINELRGNVEVGLIAGRHIFGARGGTIVGEFICLGLVASISAMTWIGPRVAAAMGEDLTALRWLAHRNARGVPDVAMLVQLVIVAALIVSSTFEKVMVYIQFALTLSSFLTVLGLFVLRRREPALARPFRVPLHPLPGLVFLAISGWMLVHILRDKPVESLAGLATFAVGLIVYFLSPKSQPTTP